MSRLRPSSVAAWLLIAASLGSIAGLQYGLITKLDRWDVLPFALLAHGAILPAVAACSLTWREGPRAARFVSRVLTALTLAVWLHTWLGPLQEFAAWVSIQWYLWLRV